MLEVGWVCPVALATAEAWDNCTSRLAWSMPFPEPAAAPSASYTAMTVAVPPSWD